MIAMIELVVMVTMVEVTLNFCGELTFFSYLPLVYYKKKLYRE